MSRKTQIERTTNVIVLDDLALKHRGMYAANGYSLYKSRDIIMDCLAQILEKCTHTAHPCITIADVGTSDGSTSLTLMNEIIDNIRMHTRRSGQIMIYYTDLPGNDFNRMLNDINAGLHFGTDLFCGAVGRTMFEQCLPNESADLIFSSITAMHLSKSPCRIQDGLHPTEANPKEMEAFKSEAALDWKQFLVARGRELCTGGYLVVLNIGTTKQGDVTLNIKGGIDTLSDVLRTLLADNLVTRDEFLDCNLPVIFRTEEDHVLPFKENDKDLIQTGLELVSTRSFVHKLNHPSFDVSNKDDATKKVYADRIVAGIKPWLYGALYTGLSCSRSQQERESLVEIYFSRVWDFAYKNDDQIPQLALVEVVARKSM